MAGKGLVVSLLGKPVGRLTPTRRGARFVHESEADDPAKEHSELLRQIVANVVLGNVDAHAKNYSLIYRTLGVPELSPLYDVVPVTDVEPRAVHLSLRIGGAILFEEVGRPP